MASGCEFVCNNKDCKHYHSGIVITAPWPMGEIDKVLTDIKVQRDPEFYAQMKKLKEQGRKYACISFPNTAKIPIEAYRIHMWCDKCPALWTYDAEWDGKQDIEEVVKNANIPENCSKCQGKTKTFMDLMDKDSGGIICPSCNVKMHMNTFFSNESEEEEKGKCQKKTSK